MIKKTIFLFSVLLLLTLQSPVFAAEDIMTITKAAGYTEVLEKNKPKASIVIDGANGQILWEENAELVREPASISKMMTVFLVFDAIKDGKLSLDTEIVATEKDQKISQLYAISNNKIVSGVAYPVRELLKMVIVPSSNVATVMLANAVSDNDAGLFINTMNEKAQKIGMKNTTFYNCSGASATSFEGLYKPEGFDPNGSNTSTARDLATMVFFLLKEHPEVLDFTNQVEVTAMKGTPYEETFETYNYSLPGAKYAFEGVDGLKTGSGPSSAFNYIATAKRGDTRLIEVILGVGDWSDQDGEYYRHPFGNALLKKAFDEYEYRLLLPKGQQKIEGKTIQLDQDFYGVMKKNEEPKLALQDKQVVLANKKEQLTEKMPRLSLNYQTVKTDQAKKEQLPSTSNSFTSIQKKNYLLPGIFAVLGIVLLFFPTKKNVFSRRKRSSKKRGRTMVKVAGAACLLVALLFFIMTLL
ncbi:D-alanyl-D-alanine carboxypeptidase [Enterococcus sp. HMSC29A04]|nr:D-alanyl-D-alanine carboxypeptidase [Enterococcus sp. HMSC29A04]